MIGFVLLAGVVSGFAYSDQQPAPSALKVQRADQKAIFDRDQKLYNDKGNKSIRAHDRAETKIKLNDQENKKVQKEQDQTKGQILVRF